MGLPASTVRWMLTRHRLHRLAWLDRPTGTVIRRYERDRPGELIHVDVKKLGRIPDGGGHKIRGREAGRPIRGMGFDYVHSAVDDHTRLAYSEMRQHIGKRSDLLFSDWVSIWVSAGSVMGQ